MRAAVEPSRVYACSDTESSRRPIIRADDGEHVWHMPAQGPWAFTGNDCKVLTRALDKLGVEKISRQQQGQFRAVVQSHLSAPADPLYFDWDPDLYPLGEKTVIPAFRLMSDRLTLVPCTPVYYVHRRYGLPVDDMSSAGWELLRDRPVIRLVRDGVPLALVALTIPRQRFKLSKDEGSKSVLTGAGTERAA